VSIAVEQTYIDYFLSITLKEDRLFLFNRKSFYFRSSKYVIRYKSVFKDITPRLQNKVEKLKSIYFVAIMHPRIVVKLKQVLPSSFRV